MARSNKSATTLKEAGLGCRAAFEKIEDTVDALAADFDAARERISELFLAADGDMQRTEEFQSLQWLVPNLPAMILLRLAYREPRIAIPNISGSVNREEDAPSVVERFEPVLSLVAPRPGRPKKLGDEGEKA